MTSRSEADALRGLIKTLNKIKKESEAAVQRIVSLKPEEPNPYLWWLAERHYNDHIMESLRMKGAIAFYEHMLAQAEERERAPQDNQSE